MFLRRSFSIFGLFVSVVVLCAVMSCVQEAPDADNQQGNPDGLAPKLSIEDARMFFTDYAGSLMFGPVSGPRPETKGSGDSGEDVSDPREPSWEVAEYVNLFGEDIIEVPFDGVKLRIDRILESLPMPEGGEIPASSNPNTLLRLAAGLNAVGEIYYTFVYATPTEEWLSSNGLTVETMSLGDIGDNYSGDIRYYTPDGEFLMGFVCEDGSGVRSMEFREDCEACGNDESGSDGESAVTPNAVRFVCDYHYEIWGICKAFALWDRENGTMTVTEDICQWAKSDVVVECWYTEDGSNNGSKYYIDPVGPGGSYDGDDNNDNDDEEEEEEEEEPEFELEISPFSCDMGDDYSLSISCTSRSEVDIRSVKILVSLNGAHWAELNMSAGVGGNATMLARRPGTLMHKAVIKTDKGEYETPVENLRVGFPDRYTIVSQPEVQAGMAESWSRTLASATATSVQEHGGMVVLNTQGGSARYEVIHFQGNIVDYDNINSARVDMQFNGDYSYDPRGGCILAVMAYHTHPPLFNYRGNRDLQRDVGPSNNDIAYANTKKPIIPQVVYDFVGTGGIHTNKDSKSSPTKLYHYGVGRRTDLPY